MIIYEADRTDANEASAERIVAEEMAKGVDAFIVYQTENNGRYDADDYAEWETVFVVTEAAA